ncbi:unnamed protein product [Microthlaspi erraticum]|uniref:UDP-glycosyltransferases domain-containing protein n=1 Tax=Microthlaspi erraticum TaxID=1685480 RepID=A0A6D2L783_9BRAS|nr:unnamed protein product [Microthlaspi erraticum]
MEESKGKRILMFPVPFTGHFNPMIQLAGIFHQRGFSVTILHTSFNAPDPSRHPHFTFRTIRPNNEGEEEDPLSKSETSRMDLDILNTVDAAEEVGVRRLVLRTSGAASFVAYAAYPLLRDKGYFSIQDSRSDDPVIELPPLKAKDLPVIETNDPEELYRIFTDMVEGTKSSSGVIWNTFEDLEGPQLKELMSSNFQAPFFPIGPIHKHCDDRPSIKKNKEDDAITHWLDKQDPNSVVYASFGSLAGMEEKEFLEIAWGLRNSEQPFLWVVRQGSVQGTDWLEA